MPNRTGEELDRVWDGLTRTEKQLFWAIFRPLDNLENGQARLDAIESVHIQLGYMSDPTPPTDAGAEEYEEAMRGEELMYGR